MTDYAELRAAVAQSCHALLIDDPDTIRALLAERDSLGEFASAFLLWAATGANPDRLEGLINIARAALAQGERHETV